MIFMIETFQGEEILICCECFADLDNLYNSVGIDPDCVISIRRFDLKDVKSNYDPEH